MKFNAETHLGYISDGTISLQIDDRESGGRMISLTYTKEQFCDLLASRLVAPTKADVSPKVKYVGRKKVSEDRTMTVRFMGHDRRVYEQLLANLDIKGWFVNSYLGSQNSINYVGKKVVLRFSVYRYLPRVKKGVPQ